MYIFDLVGHVNSIVYSLRQHQHHSGHWPYINQSMMTMMIQLIVSHAIHVHVISDSHVGQLLRVKRGPRQDGSHRHIPRLTKHSNIDDRINCLLVRKYDVEGYAVARPGRRVGAVVDVGMTMT